MRNTGFLWIIVLLLFSGSLYAQTPTIDSLKKVLREKPEDAATYNNLAGAYIPLTRQSSSAMESVIRYARKGLELAREQEDKAEIYDALITLAWAFQSSDVEKSIAKADSAIIVAKALDDAEKHFKAVQRKTTAHFQTSQNRKALKGVHKMLELNRKREEPQNPAVFFNLIGIIEDRLGRFDSAIHYYQQALGEYDSNREKLQRALTLSNIGNIYFEKIENYKKAMSFYTDAYKLFKELYDKKQTKRLASNLARSYTTIGQVYKEQGKLDTAMQHYQKAIKLVNEYEFPGVEADVNSRIGDIYFQREAFTKANEYYQNSLDSYREDNDQQGIASVYKNLGELYLKKGSYQKALEYTQKSKNLFDKFDQRSDLMNAYHNLSKIYSKTDNYKKALKHYKSYSALKDSTLTEKSMQQINELQTRYETKKKEREIKLQKARIARQRTLSRSLAAVILLVIVAAFLAYRGYVIKKRSNEQLKYKNAEISQQKEEIETQRDEIEQQRDVVVKQKEEITDSIFYASRIQQALLPPEDYIGTHLPEHFILNKPRDIVSGDYYWLSEKNNKIYATAADCTGHGVPGAFMSMLGISFLNEIMANPNIKHAEEVLEKLREYVINSLRQTQEAKAKDGMDMSFVVIDKKTLKLEYAGAYNPLYIIRDGELLEFKADRMPIGIYYREQKPFKRHEVQLKHGDQLYMQSDGFVDQFGGDKGRKFMSKRYKQLILKIASKPMSEQRQILDNTYEDWKSYREQVDDVLVMGIKINGLETEKA